MPSAEVHEEKMIYEYFAYIAFFAVKTIQNPQSKFQNQEIGFYWQLLTAY